MEKFIKLYLNVEMSWHNFASINSEKNSVKSNLIFSCAVISFFAHIILPFRRKQSSPWTAPFFLPIETINFHFNTAELLYNAIVHNFSLFSLSMHTVPLFHWVNISEWEQKKVSITSKKLTENMIML